MTAATTDPDSVAGNLTAMQRLLTLTTVVLASSLYGTALLTTSTILPQMQGAMSATQDEIAWAMTFNILATAIVTPMTGWLVARFGEKRVMVWSIAVFTAATMACGVRLDWFESTEIVIECVVAALAFYIFIFHCLTTTSPFLNLKLLTDRNYAIGLVLVTIYGMLNFTPMVLLPPVLQQHVGFSDALVGQVIGCRGIGMTLGFLSAGLMTRIDPRISMAFGFSLQTLAGLWMLTFDLNVTMEILVLNSAVQGFAVGTVWVPMTMVAFNTLAAKDRAEASSVFHLLRNIGSSFFISLSIAEIVRTTGANYSRMTEMITPYNQALAMPDVTGAWNFDTVPGLAKFANEIARQAAMIGYLNAFMMYTVTSALAVVFVLMVRRKARTGG